MHYEGNGLNDLLARKKEARKTILKQMCLKGKRILVAVILDKEPSEADKKLIEDVNEAMQNIDAVLVVLGDKHQFNDMENTLAYNRANRSLLLEAADVCLSFEFNDVEELLLNAVVPISLMRDELRDYNPNHETGNAFLFEKKNSWSAFAGLVRAMETFKFPYDWKHIVREGLKSLNSK